jgi:ribose-phosphate pyrophosphokinase
MLMEKGALSVRALATHAVMSGPAYERIAKSKLTEVILSDTIPLTTDPNVDRTKIKVLTVSDIFADVIDKVYNYKSISTSFVF